MKKEKISYISLLQAIGILCVVVGHVVRIYMEPNGAYFHNPVNSSALCNFTTKVIFTFHMSLFVFLSGFLCEYALQKCNNMTLFVQKRIKRLIIPYIVGGMFYSIPIWMYLKFFDYSYFKYVLLLLTGRLSGHLWYLSCLLMITLIYLLIRCLPKKLNFLIGIGLFFLYFAKIHIPYFSINRISEFLIFYFLGANFYFAKDFKIFNSKKSLTYLTLIFFITSAILEYILYVHNYSGDLRRILTALAMVFLLVFGAKNLSLNYDNFIKKNQTIQFLSTNMLMIYILHKPIMELFLSFLKWGDMFSAGVTCIILFILTMTSTIIINFFIKNICILYKWGLTSIKKII